MTLICRRTALVGDLHAGGEWCACELERGQCHYPAVRRVALAQPDRRRYRLEPGQCVRCDADPKEGPSHDASANCESGRETHCTCDVCF